MFNKKTVDIDLGDGRVITLETGKLARQADGSVLLTMEIGRASCWERV